MVWVQPNSKCKDGCGKSNACVVVESNEGGWHRLSLIHNLSTRLHAFLQLLLSPSGNALSCSGKAI